MKDRGYQRGPTIIRIDLTQFEDLKRRGEYYRFLPPGSELVDLKYWINVPDSVKGLEVIDVELLGISYYSQDFPWLAVLVQSKYVVFCQYSYLLVILTPGSNQNLAC